MGGASSSAAPQQGASSVHSRSYGSIWSPSIRSPGSEASYPGGSARKPRFATPSAVTPKLTRKKTILGSELDEEKEPILGGQDDREQLLPDLDFEPPKTPIATIREEDEETNLLDDLKKELDTDVHIIGVQQLYERFGTDPAQVIYFIFSFLSNMYIHMYNNSSLLNTGTIKRASGL